MIRALLLLLVCVAAVEPRRQKRQAVLSQNLLWPDKTVFYRYKFPFTAAEQANIRLATQEWEAFTCVKFQQVPATSTKHAAEIKRLKKGCFSSTGYNLDDQTVNLGVECMDLDVVLHELGHTLGLIHEQERKDRDNYVRIDSANVQQQFMDQFSIEPDQRTYGLPYSYRSIMHYGKDFFNKKGKVAIQALQKKYFDIIGNALHISFRDAWIVNKMYSCSSHCVSPPTCGPNAFLGKDCRCWCRDNQYTAVDCVTKRAIAPSRITSQKGRLVPSPGSGTTMFWSEVEVDWHTARSTCQNMGGALISPKTSAESNVVATTMAQLKTQNYEPPSKKFQELLWTSGNDIEAEGSYKWSDGSVINPQVLEFARGEPNNGGGLNEDCVAILPASFSLFTDHDCGKRLRYICQLDSSCHDRSPACPYYRSIGSCREPRIVAMCQHTCKKCAPSAPANKVPNVNVPPVQQVVTNNKPAGNTGTDYSGDYVYVDNLY